MYYFIKQAQGQPELKDYLPRLEAMVEKLETVINAAKDNKADDKNLATEVILNEKLPELLNTYCSNKNGLKSFFTNDPLPVFINELNLIEKEVTELESFHKANTAVNTPLSILDNFVSKDTQQTLTSLGTALAPQFETLAQDLLKEDFKKKEPEIKPAPRQSSSRMFFPGIVAMTVLFSAFGFFALRPYDTVQAPEAVHASTLSNDYAPNPDYQPPGYAVDTANKSAPITTTEGNAYLMQKSLYEIELIKSYMHANYGMKDYTNYNEAFQGTNRDEIHNLMNYDKTLNEAGIKFSLSMDPESYHRYAIDILVPDSKVCSMLENSLIENQSISATSHFCDKGLSIQVWQVSAQDKVNEKEDKHAEAVGKGVGLGLKVLIDIL